MAACVVCGSTPTVRSHLFPRKLMLDLKGPDPFIHQVVDDQMGTRYQQSGPIDNSILCAKHEAATQLPDKYAIEFCRSVARSVPQVGFDGYVRNPKPELLTRFACLTVWRFCVSQVGRGKAALGPYAPVLEKIALGEVDNHPVLLLCRNHLRATNTTEATMAIAPFPTRLDGVRVWLFVISGVQFYLKLDRKPYPANGEQFAANKSDPVRLFELPAILAHEAPILKGLLSNMIK